LFYTLIDNQTSFFYIIIIMKSITKTLFFVLFFSGVSNAQVTTSATAMGTFAVLGYSTITRLADLNFGDLVEGVATIILPTDAQAAEFLFNGNANTDVDVTMTFPSDLTCGSNTLNFNTPNRPIYNTIPDAMTAVEFKKKTGGSASTGADGNLYIWVGGRARAAKNQAAGSYTGIMQIVVVQP
jgi:hypothetical protein